MNSKSLSGRQHVGDAALTNNQGDKVIIRPNRFIMALFGGVIRSTAKRLVNRAHERGILSSYALHELHAMIDRSLR